MVDVLVPLPPSLSVAVTFTVYTPATGYAWLTDGPSPLLPSPKSQAYVKPAAVSAVLGSVAEEPNVTVAATLAAAGPVRLGVGATLLTLMETVQSLKDPLL